MGRAYAILLLLFVAFFMPSLEALAQSMSSEHYEFDGRFYESNPSFPFTGNRIEPIKILEDSGGTFDISEVQRNSEQFVWKSPSQLKPEADKVYWLKTKLIGSTVFNGEHLLHVSSEIGNDLYCYDYLDVYIMKGQKKIQRQRTGDQVALSDRPFNFWATFIKVNIQTKDTLDVFIRMEGIDRYFPLPEFGLWHIDSSSVFPRQLHEAREKVLFFGMLGIQFLFFLCLYFIEREKIHFQFSILILGIFLSFAFIPNNYHTYVPFPTWKDLHFPIFILGIFLTTSSLLKFAQTYFNYSATSFISEKVIPAVLAVVLVFDVLSIIIVYKNSFPASSSFFKVAMLSHVLAFVPFFMIAFKATKQNRNLKKLFYIAFIPLSLFFVLLQSWGFIYPLLEGALSNDYIYYLLYLRNFSMIMVVFMLGVLALSIGYRTKLLKEEKERILKQNFIAENTILENKLEAKKLKELDELKNRFFTNITHEFRTPLTVIMGVNNELLAKNEDLPIDSSAKGKIKEGHSLIQRNSKNLLHLINQILDLSKVNNNTISLVLKQGDIISFLNYLTESFYSKSQEKNIRLVFYSELKSLLMDFDEVKIQQLVYNLLSNALKFTGTGGKIIFHALEENLNGERRLIMKIADSGEGIPLEAIPHIFDRYYQVKLNQADGGTGIGLALTKELVELMDGEIKAESELGKGTVMMVSLPIRQEYPLSEDSWNSKDKPTIAPVNQEKVKEEPVFVEGEEELPLLLLVEDNKDICYYISQLVEGLYRIVVAGDGALGIERALELIPDIIISDVMMPVKDGFELTKTLKEDQCTSHIPIILLTAKATEADKVEGLKRGADAYLFKPFNKEELMIRLERLSTLRKALQDQLVPSIRGAAVVPEENRMMKELSMEEEFLQKLRDVVESHLDDPKLSIDQLGSAVGLGKSQLSRKLKALTDETPTAFIRNIRLTKGMQLLKTSDLNIGEIAYAVGFKDPNYFSRAFHKLFGVSPSTCRK